MISVLIWMRSIGWLRADEFALPRRPSRGGEHAAARPKGHTNEFDRRARCRRLGRVLRDELEMAHCRDSRCEYRGEDAGYCHRAAAQDFWAAGGWRGRTAARRCADADGCGAGVNDAMKNHKLDTNTQVFFYEQDFYVLSNFSAFAIHWGG